MLEIFSTSALPITEEELQLVHKSATFTEAYRIIYRVIESRMLPPRIYVCQPLNIDRYACWGDWWKAFELLVADLGEHGDSVIDPTHLDAICEANPQEPEDGVSEDHWLSPLLNDHLVDLVIAPRYMNKKRVAHLRELISGARELYLDEDDRPQSHLVKLKTYASGYLRTRRI